MPHGFSRAFIERLRQEVLPSFIIGQSMIERGGFEKRIILYPKRKLGKNQDRWTCLSPFSSEKTPSLVIFDDRRYWRCYSTQYGGDVFTFLMMTKNWPFGKAVAFVRVLAGYEE